MHIWICISDLFIGGSEVWVMSDLFIGQTSFKTFRPQTSFPYLGERRFRDPDDVRPVHRSDLVQDFQTSDLISLSW
ncbi:hypothetical protein ACS0TY_028801 [Phlomoides rotata]